MLMVCYPKCTTCQKALRFLQTAGIPCDLRDIKTQNPTAVELADWQRLSGLPLQRFFNTSGLKYRALGLKDQLPAMTQTQMLSLLATDGMLVKRPILVLKNAVLVGFREKEWAEKLGLTASNGEVTR